jgi:hypothetical protein
MNFKINKFSPLIIISIGIYALTAGNLIPSTTNFYSPILPKEALDTVIPIKSIYPIDTSDPIRLKLPPDIEQGYHFDPESNSYIFSNKLGNEYIDAPMGMTFSEFLKEKAKEQESSYFAKLAGISDGRGSGKAKDPLEGYKTSTSIITRLFGSDVIDIKPAGSVDIDPRLVQPHLQPYRHRAPAKYTTLSFNPRST